MLAIKSHSLASMQSFDASSVESASSLMNDASIILMIMGHRCLEDLGLTESLVYIYTLSYGQVKTFNVSKTRPTTA